MSNYDFYDDAAARHERARQERMKLSREGAKALREIFGEKAEVAAIFLSDVANGNFGTIAEAFKDAPITKKAKGSQAPKNGK